MTKLELTLSEDTLEDFKSYCKAMEIPYQSEIIKFICDKAMLYRFIIGGKWK